MRDIDLDQHERPSSCKHCGSMSVTEPLRLRLAAHYRKKRVALYTTPKTVLSGVSDYLTVNFAL